MRTYIQRRLLIMVLVLFGVSLVIFTLIHNMPGDPYAHMVSPNLTIEDRETMLNTIGYYNSLPVKYVKWVSRAARGDLGYSIRYKQSVWRVISQRMGSTLLLTLSSFILSTLIAIPLGAISAVKKNSLFDHLVTTSSLILLSIPTFFLGFLLIKVFSFELRIFPVAGMESIGKGYVGARQVLDIIHHLILPLVVLSLANIAALTRYTRSSMVENIKKDYIRTARAQGLSEKSILYKHALRNSLIPIITVLTLNIPYLFSGAILTEFIFVWPGIGTLAYNAVMYRDYPLIMGITMMIAITVLLSNLLADILYAVVDPRVLYDSF